MGDLYTHILLYTLLSPLGLVVSSSVWFGLRVILSITRFSLSRVNQWVRKVWKEYKYLSLYVFSMIMIFGIFAGFYFNRFGFKLGASHDNWVGTVTYFNNLLTPPLLAITSILIFLTWFDSKREFGELSKYQNREASLKQFASHMQSVKNDMNSKVSLNLEFHFRVALASLLKKDAEANSVLYRLLTANKSLDVVKKLLSENALNGILTIEEKHIKTIVSHIVTSVLFERLTYREFIGLTERRFIASTFARESYTDEEAFNMLKSYLCQMLAISMLQALTIHNPQNAISFENDFVNRIKRLSEEKNIEDKALAQLLETEFKFSFSFHDRQGMEILLKVFDSLEKKEIEL
ncbi:hypothetical protein [Pseudoalteromonas ardens]|nr:hypothetical protein [Pseudoalteromonas sp. R96]MDK1310042.1 hypothetical protein [Pseudoalteromonas sp. R96]